MAWDGLYFLFPVWKVLGFLVCALFVELLHNMGQVIHCRVSHSRFSELVFVSYVYASCSMLVWEDLWDALVTFTDSHDQPWVMRDILILCNLWLGGC